MMRIHLEQLKDNELTYAFEEKPQSFSVLAQMVRNAECEFLAPIRTRLRAQRVGDLVEIDGRFETTVRLTCGRCLKAYVSSLSSKFSLTYTRELSGLTEDSDPQEIELQAEDMGLIYFRGEQIDVQDAIQEQVVMAFPLRPLCLENCKGLCPKCGANLNDVACNCDQIPNNSKFAALKKLQLEKK